VAGGPRRHLHYRLWRLRPGLRRRRHVPHPGAPVHRLIFTGFILLSLGLLAGFAVKVEWSKVEWSKLIWGVSVWLIYGGILQADKWRRVTPRRVALLSVVAFSVTLATLWGISFLNPAAPL